MKGPKAQSAIEYLMTYGWMLLVVAIVGGAIFATVGEQSIESVSGFSGSSVQVKDFGLTSDSLQFSLRNGGAEKVKIEKIVVNDSSTGVRREIKSLKNLEVGGSEVIELKGVEGSDSSETHDVEVVYSTGGLSNLSVSGTVTGSFNVFNHVDLTEASFNRSTNQLTIDVKNTGNSATDSINYDISGSGSDFTGSLSSLDPGESSSFSISVDETFPLESVNLDTDGSQFVDSDSGLECTPTKGLVGYWSFNDERTRNGYVLDLSGFDNDGVLENGVVTGVDGRVGESYEFDGKDDFVRVEESSEININSNLAVYGAFNAYNLPFNGYGLILEKRRNSPSKGGYALLGLNDGEKVRYEVVDSGGASNFDSPITLSENLWYSSAMVYNGTHIRGYLDDDLQGTVSANIASSSGSDLFIGSRRNGGDNFDGLLDEVRVYNRSLSQGEVQRLYEVRSEDWAVSGCKLTG